MARLKSDRQIAKDKRTRNALLKSAVKVVGRVGYAKASIAKIAERANVSTGTFYLHFKSKNELYNELLPWANQDLNDFMQDRIGSPRCYMEYEEINIHAFFDYINQNPAFLRVMIEAEVAAPKAWTQYYRIREQRYVDIQMEAWERGEFPDYRREDIPRLCEVLTASRRAIIVRYFNQPKDPDEAVDETIETYLKFAFGALHRTNGDEILKIWGNGERYGLLPSEG